MHRSSWARSAALALVLTLALSACGDDGDTAADPTPTSPTSTSTSESPSEPAEEGTRIEVTFEGGSVSPNGERVEVAVGEPVVLAITADAPGGLHVHSTPEQEVEFDQGTSEHTLTFDRPGVVEVESHEPAIVVLQLEVR